MVQKKKNKGTWGKDGSKQSFLITYCDADHLETFSWGSGCSSPKSGHLQQVAVGVRHLAGCIATPNLPAWTGGTWAAAALVLNAK